MHQFCNWIYEQNEEEEDSEEDNEEENMFSDLMESRDSKPHKV